MQQSAIDLRTTSRTLYRLEPPPPEPKPRTLPIWEVQHVFYEKDERDCIQERRCTVRRFRWPETQRVRALNIATEMADLLWGENTFHLVKDTSIPGFYLSHNDGIRCIEVR